MGRAGRRRRRRREGGGAAAAAAAGAKGGRAGGAGRRGEGGEGGGWGGGANEPIISPSNASVCRVHVLFRGARTFCPCNVIPDRPDNEKEHKTNLWNIQTQQQTQSLCN